MLKKVIIYFVVKTSRFDFILFWRGKLQINSLGSRNSLSASHS